MPHALKLALTPRPGRPVAVLLSAVALTLSGLGGFALATSFTVKVRKDVAVTNNSTSKTKNESIVVNGHGVSVYYLSGDSKSHPLCTMGNGCFAFWPPVTVPSSATKLSKGPGVPKGKLTLWHRNGFFQVVFGGHPLYRFAPDNNEPGHARGDHITSFGGTWHVIKAS